MLKIREKVEFHVKIYKYSETYLSTILPKKMYPYILYPYKNHNEPKPQSNRHTPNPISSDHALFFIGTPPTYEPAIPAPPRAAVRPCAKQKKKIVLYDLSRTHADVKNHRAVIKARVRHHRKITLPTRRGHTKEKKDSYSFSLRAGRLMGFETAGSFHYRVDRGRERGCDYRRGSLGRYRRGTLKVWGLEVCVVEFGVTNFGETSFVAMCI